ncbi:MAG: NADAR family protein [Muribaculaceae bacterium]|nr:NADAR family protein [Muribaculaceae bacterium]
MKTTTRFSVAAAIREYYPQYWSRGIQSYPADQCAPFSKVAGKWGIFSNFASTPIEIDGITYKNSEQLFQCQKFTDEVALSDILGANGMTIKMKAKKWEKICLRPDWGSMIVDAMKFAIRKKYEQSEDFRTALEASKGFFIVEDQTSLPRKTANTWGAKLISDCYVGPNLMGQLLMELREELYG